ncbi:hypothetical protein GOBAR_AA30842 [Gossypium barbadense]|uniref:Chlorophyll(Ide) b reductase NOL, chloroplastic n=1 Tax=Gossypium barbadense TaxID=3634 RepID=A0A2P5WFG2_GOSBA|nr:hypothetical protein GOBAR_AA30842 [Gossypium barbadense]
MATATSSPTCQFLTHFGSPRPHPIIFPPISKQTHFQPYRIIANGSLRNNYFSPTPTISSNSPLLVKAQASINGEREPMVPPFNVLITGSSKGIGYALAKKFLIAGDNVIICSRSAERVESAVNNLREEYGEQRVWGTQCDVREAESVKNLVLFAQKNLGYIDIWINNAGSNAYSYKPLAEASDEDLIEVVSTNTLGLMICCREAIKMMLQQPRGGHIFNIDGAGSDGRPTPRFVAYGATKRSVVHLTKSLQPGMVTTDLLMSGATTKQAKFFINVLAEPAEVRLAFGARRNRYVLED